MKKTTRTKPLNKNRSRCKLITIGLFNFTKLISIMAYIISFNPCYREAQKALKEAAEKAGKKGPMVGGGIKKSGKK